MRANLNRYDARTLDGRREEVARECDRLRRIIERYEHRGNHATNDTADAQ